jgi:hypothetical protein
MARWGLLDTKLAIIGHDVNFDVNLPQFTSNAVITKSIVKLDI